MKKYTKIVLKKTIKALTGTILLIVLIFILFNYQTQIESHEKIWTFFSATATAFAAIAAGYAAYMSKKQVDAAHKPVLALTKVQAFPIPENETHPINLVLSNYGNGVANVLAVDLDKNIKTHIGAPINIGSQGEVTIKMWLPLTNMEYKIRLSVYYWDIQKLCYRTEIQINIKLELMDRGVLIPNWTIERDRVEELGKEEVPKTPQMWEPGKRTEPLFEPWWADD